MEYSILEEPLNTELRIDETSKMWLEGAAKWAKFIALTIAAFIIIGFGTAIYFYSMDFAGNYFIGMGAAVFMMIVTIILAIVAVYIYFLFNFSAKIKRGLLTQNELDIEAGFHSLKVFFIMTGVAGIIGILSTLQKLF